MTELDFYRLVDGKFGWQLKESGGEVIATGRERGYDTSADCRAVARGVVTGRYIPDEIHEVESAAKWSNVRHVPEVFECAHGERPDREKRAARREIANNQTSGLSS